MNAATVSTFFAEMTPILHHIQDITDNSYYQDVPLDWFIVLTDVRGSTIAIENGRYKDVNAVAAASISAMLNVVEGADIPYVFGGDGASMLIPPQYRDKAVEALVASQNLAREYFNLELRVGIVPVRDVIVEGYKLRVAKLHNSDNFQQAIFTGGGLAHAEFLFKHPVRGEYYAVQFDGEPQGNFEGFECRWNAIPSSADETVSILVSAAEKDDSKHAQIYDEVLKQINNIYGSREKRHPISLKNMHLAMNPKKLVTEAKIRFQDFTLRDIFRMLKGTMMAAFAIRFNIGRWGEYKQIFLESTDHEKFDDALRMTISGSVAQRAELDDYLMEQFNRGKLAYGIHVSTHALVTCIVFDYFGRQVHFVDAADGGYAIAAKQMKAQLKSLRPPEDLRAVS
ncbi:MAG: DUF3095 domain-containing protein [Aggregatilineales bacterium]